MEYHSFLSTKEQVADADAELDAFPSPYGVSFILIPIANARFIICMKLEEFPSPYRVSFILIVYNKLL